MATVTANDAGAESGIRRRRAWGATVRRAASLPRGRFGLGVIGFVVAIAVFGPLLAPHSATISTVEPFAAPSRQALLGGDELGRDVLSRVLDGGRVLLVMALAATVLGVGVGAASGIAAAYLQGRWDGIIMRTVDVILAFPQLVFALLLVSIIGPKVWLTVLAVGFSHAPQVARVIRSAALDISERDYVKAIELQGVKRRKIMVKEILPNLSSPLLVEAGLRLTYSIVIIAGLSFLGFGQAPPAADWGIMINENRIGLVSNPWAVVVPAILIALLTIGTNTFTDALARVSIGLDRKAETGAVLDAPVVQLVSSREIRVDVAALQVQLAGTEFDVVKDVSLQVRSGELLGLVGESGSGKTTVALALLGYTRRGLKVAGGSVLVDGTDMVTASNKALQRLRGAEVAYVPQDPASALNPILRIGQQLIEVLHDHPDAVAAKDLGDPKARVQQTLEDAGLGGMPGLLKAYPHQLSGGQQQRVALAMAFALRPSVIVLDEPTTGLDVTTQRHVLDTVRRLCEAYGVAAVYVSHDLAVVGGLVNQLVVLYAGKVMESGPTSVVFGSPSHPYTRKLLRAIPSPERSEALEGIEGQPPHPTRRPHGCEFAPRCSLAAPACTEGPVPVVSLSPDHHVRCLRTELTARPDIHRAVALATTPSDAADVLLRVSQLSAHYGATEVLFDVDLTVDRNQCVAVVGESGSGKTTLARCVVGLHSAWSGQVEFGGEVLPGPALRRSRESLRSIQFIFQNPYTALNPRKTIGRILEQPLLHFFPSLSRSEREEQISRVLADVALGSDFWHRYPDQLSGGERQRVAIARALVVSPALLVCDEITSALDVSVQATIVELLRRLQAERNLSLLFITHNLALVRSIAASVVVLSKGKVVESGLVGTVFERPVDPYTIRLMADVPKLSQAGQEARLPTE